jgi:tripartite-type tricarboxylate transporter receptor subunit TctC
MLPQPHRQRGTPMPRLSVAALLAALGLVLTTAPPQAQTQPGKPIRFIVPFGPGGTGDTLARLIGQHLSERIGKPVVVENRMGAGGNIGADVVAKSEPDGTTLLMAANYVTVAPSLYKRMSYDPMKDLAPVTFVGSVPSVLVVNESVPAKTVGELITLAKSKPNDLAYATPGLGTSTHLATELFKQQTGTEIRHVPYRANPLAMNDVIGGQIQVFFDLLTTGAPQVRAGKVRGLATTGAKRSPVLPELPTMIEAGVPNFEVTTWIAILTRAGSPRPAIDQMHTDIAAILALPAVKDRLTTLGYDIAAAGPDELAALMKSDTARWAAVIEKAGIPKID